MPQIALLWFSAIQLYLDFVFICLNKISISINDKTDMIYSSDIFACLINELKFYENDFIQTLTLIRNMYNTLTFGYNLTFISKIYIEKQIAILYPQLLFLEPNQNKIKIFLHFAKEKIAANQQSELTSVLLKLNHLHKINLLQDCVSQNTYEALYYKNITTLIHNIDSVTYKWTSPILQFLVYADFGFYKNGLMCIEHIKQNNIYNEYYAIDKKNYAIFAEELKYLFYLLNLKIINECNPHEIIIFDIESTKKLIHANVHFNINYIKKSLHLHNHYYFFDQAKIDKPSRDINLLQFPQEIKDIVFYKTGNQNLLFKNDLGTVKLIAKENIETRKNKSL